MKLIAGDKEIAIAQRPCATSVRINDKRCDAFRIVLDGSLDESQIEALSKNDWRVMIGDNLIETVAGCNTLVKHEVVFAKVLTENEEFKSLLQPILGVLSDEKAIEFTDLYPEWNSGTPYIIDTRVSYNGVLYKCITEHISTDEWTPDIAKSLWANVLTSTSEDVINPWVQPDSTNPYGMGDKVAHNDKVWESVTDNNVWEPGVYGWEEVIEEETETENEEIIEESEEEPNV